MAAFIPFRGPVYDIERRITDAFSVPAFEKAHNPCINRSIGEP